MGDIVEEVGNQAPHGFPRFYVFLSAIVAITPNDFSIAVKTVSFIPLPGVRH